MPEKEIEKAGIIQTATEAFSQIREVVRLELAHTTNPVCLEVITEGKRIPSELFQKLVKVEGDLLDRFPNTHFQIDYLPAEAVLSISDNFGILYDRAANAN